MSSNGLVQRLWNYGNVLGGGLVPQEPSREPASVLLERIATERAEQAPAPRRRRSPA